MENKSELIDGFNRNLNYLRISITDRCNLRCRYCLPLTPLTTLPHDEILSYEEILKIVTVSVSHGVTKVRITGGEPLVRQGVYEFLNGLTKIEGLKDVSITTNGILLEDNLHKIKESGIKRLNISLDSLNKENYKKITGIDGFDKVWNSIKSAKDIGFSPIKINCVAIKGLNDHELIDFAKLSIDQPYHIRFIEFMPIGNTKEGPGKQILTPEIKEKISSLGELIPVNRESSDGPALRFRFKGAKGEIGFISPISNHFCDSCNRLRLTANGMLRSCLLSDFEVNLKKTVRIENSSDNSVSEKILEAVRHKQLRHSVKEDTGVVTSQMSTIGG